LLSSLLVIQLVAGEGGACLLVVACLLHGAVVKHEQQLAAGQVQVLGMLLFDVGVAGVGERLCNPPAWQLTASASCFLHAV
jgi:hypothetical protein